MEDNAHKFHFNCYDWNVVELRRGQTNAVRAIYGAYAEEDQAAAWEDPEVLELYE